MCGIAGVYIKDPKLVKNHEGLEDFVNLLLLGVESRGRRATGLVAVNRAGEVMIDKAPIPASEFISKRKPLPADTQTVLLHTRLDTKGSPEYWQNNHPVIHNTCFTVHNGWIRNDDELFAKYGYERHGQVDSEIIPAMLFSTGFDPDKMKEAFDEMQGGIACASIDPINHPGKVILARTINSPLVVIDTPKFCVWASERSAITEAWAEKLGTPPSPKRFEEVSANKLLILSADGIERHSIPTTHTPKWSNGYEYRGPGTYRPLGFTTPTRTSTPTSSTPTRMDSRILVTTKEITDIVEGMRNRDVGVAKLWSSKHKMEFADQLGPWTFCGTCKEKIHSDDIRSSTRGDICVDCYGAWMTLTTSNRAKQLREETAEKAAQVDYADINAFFGSATSDAFNGWAYDEDFVHDMCIRELAIRTGFDTAALEYLLFRITLDDEARIPGFRDWKNKLMVMYEAEYDVNWELYDSGGDDIGVSILEEAKEIPPAQLALPAPKALTPTKEDSFKIRFTPVKELGKKCSCCRRKVKVVVERARTDERIGYCNRHFTKCSYPGCKEHPNHISSKGERLCHAHSRGKEAFSHTLLENEGFLIRSGG